MDTQFGGSADSDHEPGTSPAGNEEGGGVVSASEVRDEGLLELNMDQVESTINTIQNALVSIAKDVYDAQSDGKISWVEALTLTTTTTARVATIIGAFKMLSQSEIGAVIEALGRLRIG